MTHGAPDRGRAVGLASTGVGGGEAAESRNGANTQAGTRISLCVCVHPYIPVCAQNTHTNTHTCHVCTYTPMNACKSIHHNTDPCPHIHHVCTHILMQAQCTPMNVYTHTIHIHMHSYIHIRALKHTAGVPPPPGTHQTYMCIFLHSGTQTSP